MSGKKADCGFLTFQRDSAHAAEMARQLLWLHEDSLALADYVDVAQTLVDLFSTDDERVDRLKANLVTYGQLLSASRLSNSALTDLPLDTQLDPSKEVPLPGRLRTLAILIKDTIISVAQFPFFVVPFIFHIPFYLIGIFGAHLAEDEVETRAQNKMFMSVFISFITYPIVFFIFVWLFGRVPMGMVFAAGAVWLLAKYHTALIDQNYNA